MVKRNNGTSLWFNIFNNVLEAKEHSLGPEYLYNYLTYICLSITK